MKLLLYERAKDLLFDELMQIVTHGAHKVSVSIATPKSTQKTMPTTMTTGTTMTITNTKAKISSRKPASALSTRILSHRVYPNDNCSPIHTSKPYTALAARLGALLLSLMPPPRRLLVGCRLYVWLVDLLWSRPSLLFEFRLKLTFGFPTFSSSAHNHSKMEAGIHKSMCLIHESYELQ